jgi:hypothetical protein
MPKQSKKSEANLKGMEVKAGIIKADDDFGSTTCWLSFGRRMLYSCRGDSLQRQPQHQQYCSNNNV